MCAPIQHHVFPQFLCQISTLKHHLLWLVSAVSKQTSQAVTRWQSNISLENQHCQSLDHHGLFSMPMLNHPPCWPMLPRFDKANGRLFAAQRPQDRDKDGRLRHLHRSFMSSMEVYLTYNCKGPQLLMVYSGLTSKIMMPNGIVMVGRANLFFRVPVL